MSDKSLKVTDRRMFTPDGELREEYRDLKERSAPPTADSQLADAPAPPAAEQPSAFQASPVAAPPHASPTAAPAPAEPPPPDSPSEEEPQAGPGFFDLVGLLAEPATIYLREAHNADPQTAMQSLELARLHIDLLSVLRTKTEGNLAPSEQAMLEDVIHQLRAGYVGLRG